MNKILMENMIINNDNPPLTNITLSNKNLLIDYQSTIPKNIIINVPKNINTTIYIISKDIDISLNIEYNLSKNSCLDIIKFSNNKSTQEKVTINLNEESSRINYFYSGITTNKDNYNIIINHNSSNTISNIINKSIALKEAEVNYTIDSYLKKGYKSCLINQATKIINMDKNYSTIRPNMYIDEKDVIATHSSIIGTFNEEDIFYLNTRGINKEDSIKLLNRGFLLGNTKINISIKEIILNEINKYWR